MVAPVLSDVEVGAISTASTQAELRTLYSAVQKFEMMLRQYNDGSARPGSDGRFSAAEVQAQFTAMLDAADAAFDCVMPLNPVV